MYCFGHILVLALSISFQIGAGFVALHLMRVTRRRLVWILFLIAILMMFYRRVIAFKLLLCESATNLISNELAGLLISILIFSGILTIRIYLRELLEREQQLYEKQENLAKMNRSKDRLFSIISHDLKNPFNTILNFSQLLLRNYKNMDNEEIYDFVRRIYNSGRGGYYLLENLLLWSRFQTGTIDMKMEKLNLNIIVEENILFLIENANTKEIEFYNKMKDHKTILADKNMISTVVRNLLSNAIKFTGRGGTITITEEQNDKGILLHITDTGIGMTPEEVEALFDLETNTSRPGTEKEQGSGLGLVICREFIHQLKGRIGVKSEKGKGSTFSLYLPFHQNEK